MDIDNNVQQKKTVLLKNTFVEAFRKSMGNITKACESVGINRGTYYLWIENDPIFKSHIDDVMEEKLDFIESKLEEVITGIVVQKDAEGNVVYQRPPDTAAIIFALKTQGKKRGYYEKKEVDNTVRNPEGEKFKIGLDVKTAPIAKIDEALDNLLQ